MATSCPPRKCVPEQPQGTDPRFVFSTRLGKCENVTSTDEPSLRFACTACYRGSLGFGNPAIPPVKVQVEAMVIDRLYPRMLLYPSPQGLGWRDIRVKFVHTGHPKGSITSL